MRQFGSVLQLTPALGDGHPELLAASLHMASSFLEMGRCVCSQYAGLHLHRIV